MSFSPSSRELMDLAVKTMKSDSIRLFPFAIRDRKWKNGNLCAMMEAFCSNKDIAEFLDFDSKWLEKVEIEMKEFYKE